MWNIYWRLGWYSINNNQIKWVLIEYLILPKVCNTEEQSRLVTYIHSLSKLSHGQFLKAGNLLGYYIGLILATALYCFQFLNHNSIFVNGYQQILLIILSPLPNYVKVFWHSLQSLYFRRDHQTKVLYTVHLVFSVPVQEYVLFHNTPMYV